MESLCALSCRELESCLETECVYKQQPMCPQIGGCAVVCRHVQVNRTTLTAVLAGDPQESENRRIKRHTPYVL
jgi:hypothetical protein